MKESLIKKAKMVIGKENLEFANHAKNYISAEIILKGLGFISVPILTRLLTPGEYGVLSIYQSVISIFSVILSLGFYGAIKRYYFEDTKQIKFQNYLGSNFLFLVIFNCFSIYLIYLFRDYLASFFEIDIDLFMIGILVSSLTVFWKIYLNFLQTKKDSKKYSFITIFHSFIFLIFTILFIVLLNNRNYMGKAYAQLFILSLFSFYVFYKLFKTSNFDFKFNYIKYSLVFGIPVLPSMLSSFILSHFDRIIINQIEGATSAGLYSFAYKIGMLLQVVILATGRSWQPIFYQKFRDNKFSQLNRMAYNYFKYICFASLILILFSQELIMILADKSYHSSINLVPIVILGYLFFFLYTLYGHYTTFRKKTYLNSIYTIIAGLTNVGLNYLLIPHYGYYIAAYTTFISYGVLFILFYLSAKFILKENVISLKLLIPNFILILLIGASYIIFFNYITQYLFLVFIKFMLLIIGFYYFIFRDYLKNR